MKYLAPATVLLVVFSCNGPNQPENQANDDSLAVTNNAVQADPVKITPLNFSSWPAYWSAFKTAVQIKDTSAMLGLANFPFLQNADTFNINEFREMLLLQLEGMEKSIEPIDADGFPLQVPSIDSIRYTNFDHRDYYFGKVNGFYKLVKVITPG